ncbi:MAG: Fido protein [Patescibacteria group bacterium]|nr:Fido protein [Patescibacteria group bacterium]
MSHFEPQFTYTVRVVNELAKIERLYGQLISEQLIPSLALKLTQENQMLATHFSTSIEGNPLSPHDVTNLILGDQVPSTKSEKEVKNYFLVLTFIFQLAREKTPITPALTEKLHGQLMKGIDEKVGRLRDSGVFVGHKSGSAMVVKHNPPYHTREQIQEALKDLYAWVERDKETHPMIKAGILHHQFAYIHPFFDGNGRMARILTAYYLLINGYEVARYFILDDFYDIDRHLYSDSLHTADKGEKTMWIEYFLEGISYSLQAALGRISELKEWQLENIKGEKRVLVTRREEEVLEIVINKKAIKTSDIEKDLEVTRQQGHQLLASLVKKGLLKKYGSTKTSYYTLAKSLEEN